MGGNCLTGMQLFLYNCVIDSVDHYDNVGRFIHYENDS